MSRCCEVSRPKRSAPSALRAADLALTAVLAGTTLRVWHWAAGSSLWLDEQMIAMNIRDRNLADLTGKLDNNQSAPLGWLWLQRTVVDLSGTSERALRLVPLLFGIGILVVAWAFGRRYLGAVGTFALVAFCAVNDALLRYSSEVKHYSADAFFVLLLLGLAARVVDRPSVGRAATWWASAVLGTWLSMGATLAVPGLALAMFGAASWRRRWWPAVRDVALPGTAWLAFFVVHYQLSLRHSAGSDYLAGFWERLGYPPRTGPLDVARWLLGRPAALAADPLHLAAGVPGVLLPIVVGVLFWLLVAAGIGLAARRRPAYGVLLAAPLASALALAVLRVVPLAMRLALWLVPVLFVAVAVALDVAAKQAVHARQTALAGTAASVAALSLLLVFVPLSASAATSAPSGAARLGIDDRAAVAWMQANHRPGDLVLVVGSATRALQWYDSKQRLRPWRMVVPSGPGVACDPATLVRVTAGYDRVIGYSGIRPGFRDAYPLFARRLAELGTVTETHAFGGGDSVVKVVELARLPDNRPLAAGECLLPS